MMRKRMREVSAFAGMTTISNTFHLCLYAGIEHLFGINETGIRIIIQIGVPGHESSPGRVGRGIALHTQQIICEFLNEKIDHFVVRLSE